MGAKVHRVAWGIVHLMGGLHFTANPFVFFRYGVRPNPQWSELHWGGYAIAEGRYCWFGFGRYNLGLPFTQGRTVAYTSLVHGSHDKNPVVVFCMGLNVLCGCVEYATFILND